MPNSMIYTPKTHPLRNAILNIGRCILNEILQKKSICARVSRQFYIYLFVLVVSTFYL